MDMVGTEVIVFEHIFVKMSIINEWSMNIGENSNLFPYCFCYKILNFKFEFWDREKQQKYWKILEFLKNKQLKPCNN